MNIYAARGLTEAAASGRCIIVIVPNYRAVTDTLDTLAHATTASETPSKIMRALGNERIIYPNAGSIRIIPYNLDKLRGLSADTIYLDRGVPETVGLECMPIIAASPTGAIVTA